MCRGSMAYGHAQSCAALAPAWSSSLRSGIDNRGLSPTEDSAVHDV